MARTKENGFALKWRWLNSIYRRWRTADAAAVAGVMIGAPVRHECADDFDDQYNQGYTLFSAGGLNVAVFADMPNDCKWYEISRLVADTFGYAGPLIKHAAWCHGLIAFYKGTIRPTTLVSAAIYAQWLEQSTTLAAWRRMPPRDCKFRPTMPLFHYAPNIALTYDRT